jgi:glycosyltransferase involved in cell wall biosynthesis
MLDAVAAAPGWELDLVGPVAASDQEEAKARAELLGDRVRWHGRLPPHEAWKVASGAWVGMALLGDTPAFREAVPSKLYEYLACGLVPLVSELPRQAEVVTAADVGAVVADAAEAAARLRTWASEPALIDTMRSRGREWIDREILPLVSYDRLAERVAALAAR